MTSRHLELGVFAPTIGGLPPQGPPSFMLISTAEQRTESTFDYNRRIAEMLDRAGLELFFMAQRASAGFGPKGFWTTSLDSLTTAAALAMVTERLRIVSTVHPAFFHPGMIARIGATVDQISKGRWGLNIVSGWVEKDFRMLDIPLREHDERYQQSAEFVEILEKFWTTDGFDYNGKYFTIHGGTCNPKPVQHPHPPFYNAGSSATGKEFTAKYCDWYFTGAATLEQVKAEIADVRARAAKYGRTVRFLTYVFVLCRASEAQVQKEVEEIYAHADYEGARELAEALIKQTLGTATSILGQGPSEEMLRGAVLGVGSCKLLGTPKQVAHGLAELQAAGVDAVGLTFRHVEEELADFIDAVVPWLERMDVRQSRTQALFSMNQVAG